VESHHVWTILRDLRCNSAQGYYLNHPRPADEISGWIRRRELDTAIAEVAA